MFFNKFFWYIISHRRDSIAVYAYVVVKVFEIDLFSITFNFCFFWKLDAIRREIVIMIAFIAISARVFFFVTIRINLVSIWKNIKLSIYTR